ncbi:GAF domain-containing protein [Fulvivirgaceae bacterium BMA10]|uniref:GAF domain-containing protein n=1 Tax=Splendidivirga corallicola TaxID=3051826 RepID=A0ABT8KWA1_9BACT|nr:GAF domain-containing protein [Fulvivirgaceae bacterium BMA10]
MNLRFKIAIIISSLLFAGIILISGILIIQLLRDNDQEIKHLRQEQESIHIDRLRDVVDLIYGVVESEYQINSDPTYLEEVLAKITSVKLRDGDGAIWITNDKMPYPAMIIDALNPGNNGKILSGDSKDHGLHQRRVEMCLNRGEATLNYTSERSSGQGLRNKVSHSKIFKPLGWIISVETSRNDAIITNRLKQHRSQLNRLIAWIAGIAILILGAGILVAIYFSGSMVDTLKAMQSNLDALARGKAIKKLKLERKDEIGSLINSLDNHLVGLASYTDFAKEIGANNFDYEFKPLSEEDILGNELLSMRDNLRNREEEDKIRNWFNEGLAKFGEILRNTNTGLKELCDDIIQNYTKYLDANQGSIFLLEGQGEEQHLELISSYAFKRKKHIEKKIEIRQGLAGQCVLEKSTIHLKEVPEHYINIRSGLGDAPPRAILITPLLLNEEVYGVIEIATFKQFESHQIEFAEKLCESIASVISTVRINEKTKGLLEESQGKAEELRSQEEEMRQNMEELEATQEELSRQTKETKNLLEQLENDKIQLDTWKTNVKAILDGVYDMILVVDKKGTVEDMNLAGELMTGFKKSEIEGQHFNVILKSFDLKEVKLRKLLSTDLTTRENELKKTTFFINEITKVTGKKYQFLIRDMGKLQNGSA